MSVGVAATLRLSTVLIKETVGETSNVAYAQVRFRDGY
jgi:hypothetical protein